MGIDRPDDDDTPVADESDAPDQPLGPEPDFTPEADRDKYCAEYQSKVDSVYLAAARERWDAVKPGFEEEWRQHAEQHPAPLDSSPNIDQESCAEVERGCKGIRETEENLVTPAMLRIEAEDPERHLVGLEFRCKDEDRITEKVARQLESQPELATGAAMASIKDAIRYTFKYSEDRYTEGVRTDSDRLKAAGFELVELRNSWGREEYKGINSRWRIPENGQLFEVQFHTQISFEAKQLTHQAYERLRIPGSSKAEREELEGFQRRVNMYVPVPQGAPSYPDYP